MRTRLPRIRALLAKAVLAVIEDAELRRKRMPSF
jgi:hypothetical protein